VSHRLVHDTGKQNFFLHGIKH